MNEDAYSMYSQHTIETVGAKGSVGWLAGDRSQALPYTAGPQSHYPNNGSNSSILQRSERSPNNMNVIQNDHSEEI